MKRKLNIYGVLAGLAVAALIAGPQDLKAISGIEGTFEYAFDAPWRIEPNTGEDLQLEWGDIPIQLSIHDAMHSDLDPEPHKRLSNTGVSKSPHLPCSGFGTPFGI